LSPQNKNTTAQVVNPFSGKIHFQKTVPTGYHPRKLIKFEEQVYTYMQDNGMYQMINIFTNEELDPTLNWHHTVTAGSEGLYSWEWDFEKYKYELEIYDRQSKRYKQQNEFDYEYPSIFRYNPGKGEHTIITKDQPLTLRSKSDFLVAIPLKELIK
jgi:hypothetical protein